MIIKAEYSHRNTLAEIHSKALPGSFLGELGIPFLCKLYEFLIKKELVFISIEENKVTGFVSFSRNSSGMMRKFLYSCPQSIPILMKTIFSSPAQLKRVLETFTAPFKSKAVLEDHKQISLPSAELLSIAVNPDFQRQNIGLSLLDALEKELNILGINTYKVIAGESLTGANKFYLKNGFVLAAKIKIHGNSISNVYVKSI